MDIIPGAFLSRFFSPLLALALVLNGLAGAATATASTATTSPTLAHLVGQKLIIRMDGTTPSASLLGRVQRGEIGGIVLFGFNITTKSALISAVSKLQAAAAAGGQPPLLIMVDQEGGTVRRIPWAGPTLSARQMGIENSVDLVTQQGSSSAAALDASSINVNLAPVADVADSTASFMYKAGPDVRVQRHPRRAARPGLCERDQLARRRAGLQALPGHRPGDPQHGPVQGRHRGVANDP